MGAIRVIIKKEESLLNWSFDYTINILPTPEFMMEPFITGEEKAEVIAQAVKEELYHYMTRKTK